MCATTPPKKPFTRLLLRRFSRGMSDDGSMGMGPVYLWIEFGGHDYNQESDRGLFEIWRKGRLIILLTM